VDAGKGSAARASQGWDGDQLAADAAMRLILSESVAAKPIPSSNVKPSHAKAPTALAPSHAAAAAPAAQSKSSSPNAAPETPRRKSKAAMAPNDAPPTRAAFVAIGEPPAEQPAPRLTPVQTDADWIPPSWRRALSSRTVQWAAVIGLLGLPLASASWTFLVRRRREERDLAQFD
jgi:hypothetical protein